jgi:hypothetical protein
MSSLFRHRGDDVKTGPVSELVLKYGGTKRKI